MKKLLRDKKFKKYFHRRYKKDEKIPRGGRDNPDMFDEEVLEAWEEYKDLGGG